MPRTSTFKRTLRKLFGLPHERGIFKRHPEFLSKGSPKRSEGTVRTNEKNETRFAPGWPAVDNFADLERGDVPTASLDTYPRTGIDAPLALLEEKIFRDGAAGEGDASELSVSFGEDVWHLLTVDLSITKLLVLEITLEIIVIVVFALILFVVDIAEGATTNANAAATLRDKLLLSLTAVRLTTDSIFGWAARKRSTGLEVAILAGQAWCHWLLLSVAAAVIVARALKPLRQVVFSPDCCINETELIIRMHLIRHNTVTLYNLQFTLILVANDGDFVANLPLPNDVTNLARWTSALPVNIRHVIDTNSPLHPSKGFVNTINHVRVAVSATDSNGLPVNASMVYFSPGDPFYGSQSAFRQAFSKRGYIFPRVLRGYKFQHQTRMFRNLNLPDAPFEKPKKLPLLTVDFDAMGRTQKCEEV
ncbi:hypothetical protein N8152_00165 [bacterium]|jgi:hypothetical protein|nr:hypothetical protein [bacterium]|tara:strand:+ start:15480 stop:16736 length:1257 start_codon:yes stop_codon:yes gene_type:complete